MNRMFSKVLFIILAVSYAGYLLGMAFYTELLSIAMGSWWLELYGFVSGMLVLNTILNVRSD